MSFIYLYFILFGNLNPFFPDTLYGFFHALRITSGEHDWQLRRDERGIQIYSRKNPVNSITELKAVTLLNASIKGAVCLIKDADAGPLWVDRMKSFTVLKNVNEKEWYTHSELEIPWPFDNRDIITHNIIVQDSITKTVIIYVKGDPTFIPTKKNTVRMQASDGTWIIKSLPNNRIEVTYTFWSAPGTLLLPSRLSTPIVVRSFYNTFSNMKTIIQKEKYRTATLKYIK